MIRKNYLIHKNLIDLLITQLTIDFGLPEINSSFAIYAIYQNKTLEIRFLNDSCYLRSYDKASSFDKKFIDLFNSTPPIKVENNNIKYFLRIIHNLGFPAGYISGEITQLHYNLLNNEFINFDINTPIGNILAIKTKSLNMKKYSRFFSTELSPFNIERLFVKTKKEKIFNKSKILNNKIINYGNKFGIDLNSSGVTNIASKLSNKSNDYSCFEDYYERIIGTKLNSDYQNNNLKIKKSLFKPCSIIICSYNSNDSIIHTLYSIESQNLSKKQKRGIDVVIIDDGSATPLTKHLQPHINHFSFKTNIIRIEKNKGLANARNIGAINAMYEHILFLDSDILLSNNYLIEHSIALQLFPNGIFVSMKKNIEKESKINTLKNITNGINVPVEYDDKRITKVFREDQNWVNKVNLDGVFEALSDTSLFKSFGYGRNINGYDLPSMVVGHNMSLNKRLFIKAGGFSSFFIGWGLEDTFFGARVISEGGFVVPLINTGVYHINHPPRSGSDSKREEEYYNNLVLYRQLITKEI